jgi:hypothetical protein
MKIFTGFPLVFTVILYYNFTMVALSLIFIKTCPAFAIYG